MEKLTWQGKQKPTITCGIIMRHSTSLSRLFLTFNGQTFTIPWPYPDGYVHEMQVDFNLEAGAETFSFSVQGECMPGTDFAEGDIVITHDGRTLKDLRYSVRVRNNRFSITIKPVRLNGEDSEHVLYSPGGRHFTFASDDLDAGPEASEADDNTHEDAEEQISPSPAPPLSIEMPLREQPSYAPPLHRSPKEDPGGEVELFYATNRTATGDKRPNNFYGNESGDLTLGKATVSIPPGHQLGEIERPRKILLWCRKENVAKDIVLTHVGEMPTTEYYAWLKDGITKSESKAALIFIHGYNTSFAEAAWRCAQITYDIPFNNGISGFFSWPSDGKTLSYLADGAEAEASVPKLEMFIKDLVNNTGVEQLHFIAHSMGNVVLTGALKSLSYDPDFMGKVHVISQVILAAPDIDKKVFNDTLLPRLKQIGKRRTLYANDQDKALRMSRTIRMDMIRIGEAGGRIYICDGLDTIDASNVTSEGNHHSYMFECKELLTDLSLILNEGLGPDRRGLREIPKDPLKYWLFRK